MPFSIDLHTYECLCFVCFSCVRLPGKNVSEMTSFCQVGCKTFTQSFTCKNVTNPGTQVDLSKRARGDIL